MSRSSRAASKTTAERRYHHGDLAAALLKAAETVLVRDGLDGLTLRAVAREAGVSHTAPQHHFGDLTGLLSELAAIGFARFRDALLARTDDGTDARSRGRATARGYVAFARENPDLFFLMFRSTRLDMRRPALAAAADAAFAVLARQRGVEDGAHTLRLSEAASITGAWAFVHGLAFLAIDRRLTGVLNALAAGTTEDDLLGATIDGMIDKFGAARRT